MKKNWKRIILLAYISILPVISFADGKDTSCNPAGGKICNPVPSFNSIPGLIQTILEGLLKIGMPIVALAVIYSGFLFVFARGNSEKLGKAKDTLLYTLIGAAILLGSWAIAKLISVTVIGLGS